MRSCYIRPLVYRGYGTMGLFPLDAPVDVDDRRLGVGRLPRRRGQAQRRPRQGLVLAADRRATRSSRTPRRRASTSTRSWRRSSATRPATRRRSSSTTAASSARARARTSSWCATASSSRPPQTAGILDGINRKVDHPDRPRPRLRGRRARHRARRAVPRRGGLPHRHGRRADAGPRGRRPPGRHRAARRDHPGGADRLRGRAARPDRALPRVARLVARYPVAR